MALDWDLQGVIDSCQVPATDDFEGEDGGLEPDVPWEAHV